MNIIVYAHSMEIGGSQLNAIEIGAAVQSQGHNVLLVAEDGRLNIIAKEAGLEHIRIPYRRQRPSPTVMKQLCEIVKERKIDVIHGYEWPPVLDSWLGPRLWLGTPVVATVMSGAVAPFMPRSIPLIVGVEKLRQQCAAEGFIRVDLLEPPVNIHANSPDIDGALFRSRHSVGANTILIVTVCRLARELKLEGLLTACRVVGDLARAGADIRLIVVGDGEGPVRAELEAEAARANELNASASVVVLAGEMMDPRPAYAGADIILGMGGSALRGMAFGKPLVVQGEAGYWRLLEESSASCFLDAGWYGVGESGKDGPNALRLALMPLLKDPSLRTKLGQFGRDLVVTRFSLEHAARVQLDIYEQAIGERLSTSPSEIRRTIWGVGRHNIRRRWARLRGTGVADDFNALHEKRT